MRELFDPAIVALAAASLVATALLARRLVAPYVYREPVLSRRADIILIAAASGAVAAASTGEIMAAAVSAVLLVALVLTVAIIIPRLSGVGAVLTSLPLASMLVAAPWGYLWLAELGYPSWFLKAYLAGAAIGAVGMPYTFLVGLAQSTLFTHASWRRPTAPLSGTGSVHGLHSPAMPC